MVFEPPDNGKHGAGKSPYLPKHDNIYAPLGTTVEVSGTFQFMWILKAHQLERKTGTFQRSPRPMTSITVL